MRSRALAVIRHSLGLGALVACLGVAALGVAPLACSSSKEEAGEDPVVDAAVEVGSDASSTEGGNDVAAGCDKTQCSGPGKVCKGAACIDDCRPSDAGACAAGTACDFTDGACKAETTACFLTGEFDPCPSSGEPNRACGPGLLCDGKGNCARSGMGCTGETCDASGRCWGTGCPCERPAPACSTATLENLNKPEFVGSLVNDADGQGAFDLDFDALCNAYAVTMISGPDYLRQIDPMGTVTSWNSTTNLNMGQVAVLRVPTGEFKELGDVAATYICCATCGCIETGEDGRIGVVRLDRASATRPLPNVLPAKPTTGAGPFGSATLDTGPYALTWGADRALYAGNIETNGDFMRVDLATKVSTLVSTFEARVTAAAIYDLQRLLVAVEGGKIHILDPVTKAAALWGTVSGHVTSLRRDRFTGRVYAEIATTPPQIVEISADGASVKTWQTPPRLGRIAIAPDGHLYHLSVFPAVNWKAKTSIVRWPLPATR